MKLKVKIGPENFTRVFYDTRAAIFEPGVRRIVNVGSGGSTKSYSLAQIALFMVMEWRSDYDGIILRKVGRTLRTSVIPLIMDSIIPSFGLQNEFKFNKSDFELVCLGTGRKIYFLGMDDPEKIKSVPKIGWVWPEETTEFDESDLNQLTVRLRGVTKPIEFYSYNPISELHPLCKTYQIEFNPFDHPTTRVIHSTYEDNPWIVGPMLRDESFFVEMQRFKRTDPFFYRVYYEGLPGVLNKGGEFYRAFDQRVHVIPVEEYDCESPIHLTFDENVVPFMACNVIQAYGTRAAQIDEIHIDTRGRLSTDADKTSVLDRTLKEFERRYPPSRTRATVYVYGDSTSLKRDVKLDWGSNLFALIVNKLRAAGYVCELRVPASAPAPHISGSWQNDQVFGNLNAEPFFFICENCKSTINDYVYVKSAEDGNKLKQRIKDKATGQSYELHGHASDANDYFLARYFRTNFDSWRRSGIAARHTIAHRSNKRF